MANFPYWLEILCEKFTLRKIIEVATESLESVYSGLLKPSGILDDFERYNEAAASVDGFKGKN